MAKNFIFCSMEEWQDFLRTGREAAAAAATEEVKWSKDVNLEVRTCPVCLVERDLSAFRTDKGRKISVRCKFCKRCGTCNAKKHDSEFVSNSGKIVKNCFRCRNYFKTRSAGIKRKREETVPEEGHHICVKCNEELPANLFKGEKREVAKMCEKCRAYAAKNQKSVRDKEREIDIIAYKEKQNKKAKRDRELIKQSKKRAEVRNNIAKVYRKKFPEKQYYDNALLSKYRTIAKKRDLVWSLDEKDARILFNSICFYCGQADKRGKCGIDRVNNSEGYVYDNCVACCLMCNRMKKDWSLDSFLLITRHIAAFNHLDNNATMCFDQLVNNKSIISYEQYRAGAVNRSLEFEIDSLTFNSLKFQPCYLCGIVPVDGKENGIDRIDNKQGYLVENCAPCCGTCNFMKWAFDLEDFKNQCKLISMHCKDKIVTLKGKICKEKHH